MATAYSKPPDSPVTRQPDSKDFPMLTTPSNFWPALIALIASLMFWQSSQAMTMTQVDTDCPICQKTFPAQVPASGTSFGQRLDLRRIGPISSPWELPLCPTCGLVVYQEPKTFTPQDLKTIREVMGTQAYKNIPAGKQTYHRLALIFQAMKVPPNVQGFVWLEASWQVEDDAKLNKELLTKSLACYEAFLANPPAPKKDATDEDKTQAQALLMTARFMKGELLRRLGRFKEAKLYFTTLAQTQEVKDSRMYTGLIQQELDHIAAENADPQEVKPGKEKSK
jgi:hypothetical protein